MEILSYKNQARREISVRLGIFAVVVSTLLGSVWSEAAQESALEDFIATHSHVSLKKELTKPWGTRALALRTLPNGASCELIFPEDLLLQKFTLMPNQISEYEIANVKLEYHDSNNIWIGFNFDATSELTLSCNGARSQNLSFGPDITVSEFKKIIRGFFSFKELHEQNRGASTLKTSDISRLNQTARVDSSSSITNRGDSGKSGDLVLPAPIVAGSSASLAI